MQWRSRKYIFIQFNNYERGYIEREKKHPEKSGLLKTSVSIIQFYTGGPDNKTPAIPPEAVNTICQILKAQFF
jgi:hypothetical protein